jgi:hypothetical protein
MITFCSDNVLVFILQADPKLMLWHVNNLAPQAPLFCAN